MSPTMTFKRRSARKTKSSLYGTPDIFPFLLLPAELRNYIYSLCFTRPHPFDFEDFRLGSVKAYELREGSPKYPIAFLSVNRQIHDEATDILYGDNEFHFRIGCAEPMVCAWKGPPQTDTFNASMAPSNVRKIRKCAFKLYRHGWGKESLWMKHRIRDMARLLGGEHRMQHIMIDFKNFLLSKHNKYRSRLYGPPGPDDAVGSVLVTIKEYEVEMLNALKHIYRVRCVDIRGVTKEYASELKTVMEGDEPIVVEVPETREVKTTVKRRAKKRRKQSDYYRYKS
ncbi:MAG: hypothetical protein M1812_000212 [Candelaria pacifica]|nr:MAG: hypothetical protein M1812_000212 [Candelaria pacifica]